MELRRFYLQAGEYQFYGSATGSYSVKNASAFFVAENELNNATPLTTHCVQSDAARFESTIEAHPPVAQIGNKVTVFVNYTFKATTSTA